MILTTTGLFADTAAVLPFANRTSVTDPTQASLDWIGESIAETVRDAIGSRGAVTLSRAETDEAYRQLSLRPLSILTEASMLKIGEALDAEQVVYGSFEFLPDPSAVHGIVDGSLRITARIFDRRRFKQSSEFMESGNLDDLPALEAHLAWRALVLLTPRLAPQEADFRTLRPPVRLDAEESYVRGLLARSPEQQERFFLQSARLDARFGHPHYELGRMHYERKEYGQAADWLQKIASEDVHFREASFLLGLALFQSGDFAGAQKSFQAVADVVPLSEVYNDLGAAQNRRNLPQAVDSFRKALDGDPNDPVYIFNLGYALWKKGDFAVAADRFRAVLDRQPDDDMATLMLGLCLKKQNTRLSDARVETLERLKTNYEERAYLQLKALVSPVKP
ncbi:MAG: tetratricopeptide repeat protein [Acidobacteriota bacterium]